MNPNPPRILAVDTNVAIDLVQRNEWVTDAIATLRRRLPGCSLLIPPTVMEELAWLADNAAGAKERQAARDFLVEHRGWHFQLQHQVPLGDEYVAQIAERLLTSALLPAEEFNDAQILAESAALGAAMLLTSDEHLRAIDFQSLTFELARFNLGAPLIATPREIVRRFFG